MSLLVVETINVLCRVEGSPGLACKLFILTANCCLTLVQVKQILVEGEGDSARAVGVRLADGRVFRGKAVVSNATRWDTFERLLAEEEMPEQERLFRWVSCTARHPIGVH